MKLALTWNQLKEQIESLPAEKRSEFVKIWIDTHTNDFRGVVKIIYDEECGVGPYIC